MSTREEALEAALRDCLANGTSEPKACRHDFLCVCPYVAARAALAMPKDDNFKAFRDAYVAEMREHEDARLLRVAEAAWWKGRKNGRFVHRMSKEDGDKYCADDLAKIVEGVK